MKVRLTKKYAEEIDGVDLSRNHVGDTLDLPQPQAHLLLAEQWAAPERREGSQQRDYGRRSDERAKSDECPYGRRVG
jgi:hypothetical protein